MCLSTTWDKQKLQALIDKSRDNPIRAWKVVYRAGPHLKGPYRLTKYKTGYKLNVSRGHRWGPNSGFHAYATKAGAELNVYNERYLVIPCLLWDIVGAGTYNLRGRNPVAYVARKMLLLC